MGAEVMKFKTEQPMARVWYFAKVWFGTYMFIRRCSRKLMSPSLCNQPNTDKGKLKVDGIFQSKCVAKISNHLCEKLKDLNVSSHLLWRFPAHFSYLPYIKAQQSLDGIKTEQWFLINSIFTVVQLVHNVSPKKFSDLKSQKILHFRRPKLFGPRKPCLLCLLRAYPLAPVALRENFRAGIQIN